MSPTHLAELRALARLASEGAEGASRVAEGVHANVWQTVTRRRAEADGRARGLTGVVYRWVRALTRLVGWSADNMLRRAERRADAGDEREETRRHADLVAVANGVLGDRLAAEGSVLATSMTLRAGASVLAGAGPWEVAVAGPRVAVFVHGLCMNELGWETEGRAPHAEALATLGWSVVTVRYNSGRHISESGRDLDAALGRLVGGWPVPVDALALVTHSMGGLVARSAAAQAAAESPWRARWTHLVCLGTPHHGSPVERAGNWVDALLASRRTTAPLARLGQIRSAGVTDLRHAALHDADWQDRDRFERRPDDRTPVPLPEGVACYAVAATLTARRGALAERVVGDGLVPLRSALGEHPDAGRALAFDATETLFETSHLGLLTDPEVTRALAQWLAPVPDRP